MVTCEDNRNGLVKVTWAALRDRVSCVEPAFAALVDNLSPDSSYPIYLAYLPYGSLKGDTESTLLPKIGGGSYRLTDPCAPKDVIKHLGYGKNSSPLGMVLEKQLEYFLDLRDQAITIPWSVYTPGRFFAFGRNLNQKSLRTYVPNGVLTVTSGARSAFMLPNIGCATNHSNLQRDFNVGNPAPKNLYEHWHIFKEIINSGVISCDWRSCIMYFSEKWVHSLHNDDAWMTLKMYLYEQAWNYFEYERSRIFYDIAFCSIQKRRNLKPNPYLSDTAKHLFMTALGDAPGYAPATCDTALPFEILQQAFVESYGLKKYLPTLMQPTKFSFELNEPPVYYSLQNPSTFLSSPKSRKIASTLYEMRELQYLMKVFCTELLNDSTMCSDTVIRSIAKDIDFNFYHNKVDRHRVVVPSTEIANKDNRFCNTGVSCRAKDAIFSSDAPFVRGCISISKKLP